MASLLLKVLVMANAFGFFVVDGTPVGIMHGDLCRKMNGRKYYLEANTHAIITATNVTLPAFPRIATQNRQGSGSYHHSSRRHRREGPLEIGLLATRFRRNITSISLSSLASASNMVAPKVFVPPSEPPRLLTPLSTPTLDSHTPSAPEPPSSEPPTTSSPLLLDESEEDLESESSISTSVRQPFKCGVEIMTRPDCHLEVTFEKVNLPSCSHDKSCRCDYIRLREPPYRGVGGLDVCSAGDETPNAYMTQTKEVRTDFLYTRAYADAFKISITAKRNKYRVIGKANSTTGYIRSPFFPELYPKEHWMEYDLVAKDENTRIKVTFLDFQLSPWSFVEIQDTNKSRLAVFNGNLFRPPVLVSSGPHLTVRFSGNGETARGFNMEYAFIDATTKHIIPPITDCGGYVTNFGGTITMMNMSKDDTNYTMFDCVWIVQPPQNYAFKSHLSIRVVQFEEMASETTLEIRQGVTSDDYLLERIEGGGPKRTQEHVVAVDTGFYVRLRGFFNKNSKLAIVYTSFSYLGSCYAMTDLMCHNHRCIPKMLRCDGFDHCGDNSDEPTSCYGGTGAKGLTPQDAAWWYQHTPNYYFPQKSPFLGGGPHGWSGVLLLTSLIVMVMLMIGLISYMFNTNSVRSRQSRRTHNGGHSRRGSIDDDVEVIDASADDPPLYEPPPDYEEVIKVILSGNNLKLVRRPGGVTAWVPDKLADEAAGDHQAQNDRPTRTRHASLDLEQGMEVVLWNSNTSVTPRTSSNPAEAISENESNPGPITSVPFRMGHIRRSSLPTAPPTPEIIHRGFQGHSVSVAPETIPEMYESLESPRPPIRHIHTLSSPQISLRSFNYDTSAVSTPGPSTPQLLRASQKTRRSKKLSKKGGKRKKSSATRKPVQQQPEIEDDSAPPSYEDAMQQVIHSESHSPTPSPVPAEASSSSDAASQVNESTQTNIDPVITMESEELSPTDRVHAAREMFQKLSVVDQKPVQVISEASESQHVAKRPVVQVNRTKHHKGPSSGGTISRGTVKARKAMLIKAQKHREGCDCNGACSCAHFKPDSPSEENPYSGGVRSKVQYYLTIEESIKKREHDSSIEPVDTEKEPQESQKLQYNSETKHAAMKKRRLVRNQSAPTIGCNRERDLEIYFSKKEEISENTIPSPIEDMERPLITPVTDSPRPVFIVPKKTLDKKEMHDQNVSSIQNRVKLYNELSKPETPVQISPRTPSPIRSPVQGIRVNNIMRSDSVESIDEGNPNSLICMRSLKNTACDTSIKPGLVKEATAKFITTLATEIRPKLYSQESDDWNEGSDSPRPIRIPYLNLKNEVSSSPEITDNDNLLLPPLRQDEAESIELWDSISQGKSEMDEDDDLWTEECPLPSSGAVPKRSAEVTIELNQSNNMQSSKNIENHRVQEKPLVENDKEVKGGLKLNIRDKFSPASDGTANGGKNYAACQNNDPQCSRLVLEEVNLGLSVTNYHSSDDDSLPPSPSHTQNLDDTLNESLDLEYDAGADEKIYPVQVLVQSSPDYRKPQPKQIQAVGAKKKFPVPSPRGSKATQQKISKSSQCTSTCAESSSEGHSIEDMPSMTSRATSPGYGITPSSSCINPAVRNTNNSSPTPSTPRTLMTPTLSPQMERSGIVTINTSKRLKWDYI